MSKKNGFILIIIGLVLFSIFFIGTYQASVISFSDNTYELNGGVLQCGYYYSGYQDYSGFKNFCNDQGFICRTDSWEGTFGTMRSIDCDQLCYSCNNGEVSIGYYSPTCEAGGFDS